LTDRDWQHSVSDLQSSRLVRNENQLEIAERAFYAHVDYLADALAETGIAYVTHDGHSKTTSFFRRLTEGALPAAAESIVSDTVIEIAGVPVFLAIPLTAVAVASIADLAPGAKEWVKRGSWQSALAASISLG
jgi:hypothetical protein